MSLADAISASAPASVVSAASNVNRRSTGKAAFVASAAGSGSSDRPRGNSPAFQVYEDKKNACDAKIADIRARIVNNKVCIIDISYTPHL